MTVFRKLLTLSLLAISTSCESVGAEDIGRKPTSCDPSVSVKASLERSGGKYFLSFTLMNNSENSISIYNSDLPWGSINATTLVLIPSSKAADPLAGSYYIDDPTDDTATINPGKPLEGRLDISNIYPSLEEAISRKEIIVFWSHQPESMEHHDFCRAGGFLVINKNR